MVQVTSSARILIVTAVTAERDAAVRHLGADEVGCGRLRLSRAGTPAGRVDVVAAGVGAASAAAVTATLLATGAYDVVISAGIAGAFAPAAVGETVVASAVIADDLGAEDGGAEEGGGFLSLGALGLGPDRTGTDLVLASEVARRTGAHLGAVLSVSTVTGSTATAERRRTRHPDARAEAMEGAGVLVAAELHGVAFAELRTLSNPVGPRDRSAWALGPALAALADAVRTTLAAPLPVGPVGLAVGPPGGPGDESPVERAADEVPVRPTAAVTP